MKSLYTTSSLYDGLPAVMRIFDKSSTASSCEAFVEAIASMVGKHASAERGSAVRTYSIETFIHWNAPALAKADKLLSDALSKHFGDKDWHFTKTSAAGQASTARLGYKSKVMHQMHMAESKFRFME